MFKKIGINSLWLFISRILAQFLNLIFHGIVARNLGVNVFGQYFLFASVLFIGNIFTTYGTDALLIREIARERKISPSFSASAWLQILLSVFLFLILALFSIFLKVDSQNRNSLLILNLCLFPLSFQSIFNSMLRAFERMDIYSALNVLTIFTQTVLVFLFIKNSQDLYLLCTLIFLNQVFVALLSYLICKKVIPEFVSIEKPVLSAIKHIFYSGWRLALFFPISSLFQRLNLFVLSFISGQEMTGILSASTRLMDGVKLGHFSVSNSLMPSMARNESDSLLQKSFLILLIWNIFTSIGVFIFAKPLIEIIYGAAYLESMPALKIISFVLIPYTFSIYFSLRLIMTEKENLVLNAILICLPFAILVYFLLISNFGLVGAAWGTLVNEIIFAFALVIVDTAGRFTSETIR